MTRHTYRQARPGSWLLQKNLEAVKWLLSVRGFDSWLLRKISLFSIILSSTILHSQYNTNFLSYSNTGRSVSAFIEFEAGSNGVNGSLANRLIWGGHISNEVKAQSSRLLQARNNFGINLNYGVSAFLKGGKKFDYLIGFKNQEVLNATYSRDFFNLMFYGNAMYRGRTANLSNCNVNALRFQEIKFGAIMHQVDTVGKIGISLSLLKGEQLFFIDTQKNSNLYTSADGSEVFFNSNFNLALSDTANRGPLGFNGIGAAADIYFETPYVGKLGKRSVLMANANNIGFIHWWQNSVQYSSDSSLQFKGYQIRSISDLRDSTLNRINNDSLLRQLSNARKDDFNVNIPTNLVLVNKVYFGRELFALSMGFRHIFNANYKPYAFLEPEQRVGSWIFSLHAGYGGYTRMNIGAAVTLSTPGWYLRVGSNSLQGFFSDKLAYGQGVFFSVTKKLR
jgi:hypothetical protein